MGCDCSCLGGKTAPTDQKEINNPNYEANKTQAQQTQAQIVKIMKKRADQNNYSHVLSPTGKLYLQNAVRAYLTRRSLVPQLGLYRESIQNKPLPNSVNPQQIYQWFQTSIAGKLFKQKFLKSIQKQFGELNFKQKINDGIQVNKKPTLIIEQGVLYEGEWNQQGKQHGRGQELHTDGTKIMGYYKDGFLNGLALKLFPDGSFYRGNYKEGQASGEGLFKSPNGAFYKGEFKKDARHGYGQQTYPDGSVYKGDFKNGEKNGNGKFEWADGSYYEGEFLKGLFHGYGKYVFADGRTYEGNWDNAKMNGKGRFVYRDGRVYQGGYLQDLKHGFGVFSYPDGRMYRGYWKAGKEDGEGEFTSLVEGQAVTKRGVWEGGKRIKWFDDE